MADKDPNLESPEFDDELDLPDFDDSMLDGNAGKDRKPIDRIKGGFYEGVKRTALNASTRRTVIDRALPKGYGKAYDDALASVNLGQELYDTTRENLVPVKRDLKKVGRFVASKTQNILPTSIQRYLEALVKPEDDSADLLDEVDQDELTMNAGVNSVFGDFMAKQSIKDRKAQAARLRGASRTRNILGAQLDLQHKRDQRDEETKFRETVVGETRYKTETNLLNMMRSGVERLVDYQDRITASYQRKSLELQYRQFFVARDHYSLFQSYVKQTDEQLDAITKNSALPDFLKIRTSETASAMLRERTLGKLGNFAQEKSKGFGAALKTKLGNSVKSFGQGLSSANDIIEMTADAPVDPLDTAGGVAGSGAAGAAIPGLAQRLGAFLGQNESISRFGSNLDYLSDNKNEMARDYLRTKQTEGQENFDTIGGTLKATLSGALLDLMGSTSSEATYGRDASELADEAIGYTSLADKSITEIIPGLLTNILHETEMMRTKNPELDRQVYDFESGEMGRETEVQKKLVDRVLPQRQMDGIREDLTSIIDGIDTDGSLSDSARLAFTRQMLTDASAGRRFDPERYFTPRGLSEVQDETDLSAIRDLIKSRFLRDDGSFRKYDESAAGARAKASSTYNTVKDDIPNYQETIAKLLPIYGVQTLRQAGLIQEEDAPGQTRANKESILDFLNTGQSVDLTAQPKVSSDSSPEPSQDSDRPDQDSDAPTGQIDGEGLNQVSNLLSRLVDIQRSVDVKKQFANVLDAIATINPKEHLELNGRWLKDIYELLKTTLGGPSGPSGPPSGPSGPPSGPSGGPSLDLSQSRWVQRPVAPFTSLNAPPPSRWPNRDDRSSMRDTMESLKENGVASMSDYRQRAQDRVERANDGEVRMASGDSVGGSANDTSSMSSFLGTRSIGGSRSASNDALSSSRETGEGLTERLSEMRQSLSEGDPETTSQDRGAVNDPQYTNAVRDVVAYLEGKLPGGQDTKDAMASKFQALKDGAGQLTDRTQSTLKDMMGSGRERSSQAMSQLNDRVDQTSTLSQEFIGKIVAQVQDRLISRPNDVDRDGREGPTDGGDGGGEGPPDSSEDYWVRARELIQEILTHMDRKTEQLQASLENLTLSQMAGDSTDPGMLKRLGRGAASGLGGIMSFYGGMWKSAGNLASGGTGMLKNLAGKMFQGRKEQGDGIMDVYIQGHRKPAMLARDLRAGRYFDQESGDLVQRLDEITGPVVDSNGDVVISEYDIEEGLLIDGQGKSMMDRLGGLTSGLSSYMTAPSRMLFSAMKTVADVGKNWMNKPRDVYVKGEERPRLLGVLMKNGGYLSQATNKPIKSIKDIDGAIIDRQGNVVLTVEDMTQGLTDNRGRAIKGLLSGAGRLAKGAVTGVGRYMSGSVKAMGRAVKGAAGLVAGGLGLGKLMGGRGGSSDESSDKQATLLAEIRDLLEERLEKPLRKGGWRSRLAAGGTLGLPAPKRGETSDRDASEEEGGGMGALLKKMLGLGGGGALGLGADLGGSLLNGGGPRPPPGGGPRPRGRMGRMFQGIKSLGGKAARGLGTAARFALPAIASAIPSIVSAAGTVASIGGSILGGIGAVLASPVVLTGAAIAAVGVGGYLAYRYFSRKPDGPLHRVRLAQYGADPDNKDHVGKISGLEDVFADQVQFEGERTARLSDSVDMKEVMEDFGVDLEDEAAVYRWVAWFQDRFKPVFISHILVANDMIKSTDLTDTEDMDPDLKRTYLRRTQFQGNNKPYGNVSPFDELDSLSGDAKVVLELTAALKTLPPRTKAEKLTEAAESEVAKAEGTERNELPDAVRKVKTRAELINSQGRGRGMQPLRVSEEPTKAEIAAEVRRMSGKVEPESETSTIETVEAVTTATDQPSKADMDAGMAEANARNARLEARGAAMIESRQSPADQEAVERIEGQRTRQEKVARQTSVQTEATSNRVGAEMKRVASILTASHQTQISMDTSLKNIDAYFSKRRKEDEDRKVSAQADGEGFFSGRFGNKEEETTPRAGLSLRRR